MEDASNGLYQIIDGITNKHWTSRQFRQFWKKVRNGGFMINFSLELSLGGNNTGEHFSRSLSLLKKFLRKSKAKRAFGDHANNAKECSVKIKEFIKVADQAYKGKIPLSTVVTSATELRQLIVSLMQYINTPSQQTDMNTKSNVTTNTAVNEAFVEFMMELSAIDNSIINEMSLDDVMYQEALVLTAKNARDELNKSIKTTVAILNDENLDYKSLVRQFKKYVTKTYIQLSQILTTSKKTFSPAERVKLKNFKDCLSKTHDKISKCKDSDNLENTLIPYLTQCVEMEKIVDKNK